MFSYSRLDNRRDCPLVSNDLSGIAVQHLRTLNKETAIMLCCCGPLEQCLRFFDICHTLLVPTSLLTARGDNDEITDHSLDTCRFIYVFHCDDVEYSHYGGPATP